MGKDRKPLGALAIVALAAIMLSAVALAVEVDAAKGGKGKGNGGNNGSTAAMAVSPNPVPLGATSVVISGSGFAPNQNIWINTGSFSPTATTDGSGSFSVTYFHEFNMPETASMQAWSSSSNPELLATASYTVQ